MRRLLAAAILAVTPSLASAGDFAKESIPQRWMRPYLAEDLPALEYPKFYSDLDRARMEAFTGRYKLSLMTLLKTKDADPIEVALVRATSLAATGRTEQALTILRDRAIDADPRIRILTARILLDAGQSPEAITKLQALVLQFPTSIAAHFYLGQAFERAGDLEQATTTYQWFLDEPQSFLEKWKRNPDRYFENAEDVVHIGRAVDRWATLSASYQKIPGLDDLVLGMFVRAYDVIDRSYWPAHVAAAEFFVNHDNTPKAMEELKAAHAGNPNYSPAIVLLGKIALDGFNFDGVDVVIKELRDIASDSLDADLLEARNYLLQRVPAQASAPVERVLARQPNSIEALGLKAAVASLQLRDADAKAILAQADSIDGDQALAYFEVAEQLGAMRQYPRSAEMYKIAIDRAPWWTNARNGLGLLYTQSGDEDLARATLDAAHNLDPYNLRTTNYLRLLDDLAGMARRETDHFVVTYDPTIDPIIPEFFGDYLESIHAQICTRFGHEPSVKTYIEVFPTHDAFSVRTTGSPWIGTVGASTGRVIAMVSPRDGSRTMGTFNWAQVLRHEYTHTVTLSATDNRVPHWMTEGLAVYEEHGPLRWDWVPMLYRAVTMDELFKMENLTWGFVRPKRPIDRQLAYAQAYWVCTYIEEMYGFSTILKMLEQFRAGKSERDVFQQQLGVSFGEFDASFRVWCRKQTDGWGYDEKTNATYDELREKGEALVKARDYVEAAKLWEEIVAIRPVDALPHQRLAGLYLQKEVRQPLKAIEHLKRLHVVSLKDNRFAKRIARLYVDLNDPTNAKTFAMEAVYVNPYDADAQLLLKTTLEKIGDTAGSTRQGKVLAALEKLKTNH